MARARCEPYAARLARLAAFAILRRAPEELMFAHEMDRVNRAGASLITLEDETYPSSCAPCPTGLSCCIVAAHVRWAMRMLWPSSARAKPAVMDGM